MKPSKKKKIAAVLVSLVVFMIFLAIRVSGNAGIITPGLAIVIQLSICAIFIFLLGAMADLEERDIEREERLLKINKIIEEKIEEKETKK